MSTKKKVKITLTTCFVLCLLLVLIISLLLPYFSNALREKMRIDEEKMSLSYGKRLETIWLIAAIQTKVLNFFYILWPILAALAYIQDYLSKGLLAINLLGTWVIAFFAHSLPYLGIRNPFDLHIIMNIPPLTTGLIGALLILVFLRDKKPSTTSLS